MAFDFLKKDKGSEEEPVRTPLDIVMELKQRGLSNQDVVNQLRMQGYSLSKIKDALVQADIKGGVTGTPAFQSREASPEPVRQEPTSQPSAELVSSIEEWLNAGYEESQIINEFTNAGYSPNEVRSALDSVKKRGGEEDLSEEPTSTAEELSVEPGLVSSIQEWVDKGYDEETIIAEFEKAGYPREKITSVLDSLEEPRGSQESGREESMQSQPQTGGAQPSTEQRPAPASRRYNIQVNPDVEAIIEAVVQEKWEESMESLDNVKKTSENLFDSVSSLENSVESLKEEQKRVSDKLESSLTVIRERFTDFEARIDAFEELLKKILPDLFEKGKTLKEKPEKKKEKFEEMEGDWDKLLGEPEKERGKKKKENEKPRKEKKKEKRKKKKKRGSRDYSNMTKDEVYEIARKLKVRGRSGMTKKELIKAVKKKEK